MFCPSCGAEIQNQARYCSDCGAILDQKGKAPSNRPEPPPEKLEGGQPPLQERSQAGSRVARLGDRLLAVILDGILIMAVYAVLGMAVASRWGGMTQSGFSITGPPALIALGLTAAFFFFYHWFFEGLLGATLGKLMTGIKVKDLSGGPCSLSQSFLRNLLRIIDGIALYLIGFLIAVFSKRRQRLGDHLAKTVVVETAPGAALRVFIILV
ncbi:MAG: RDD family protein, partial [Thermodesulfobacteriota bacterium]